MPNADARRWNARYAQQADAPIPPPRPLLVRAAEFLPPAGLALEVAMGLGGSAAWLWGRGWRVIGLDIAAVAVRRAKAACPGLAAAVVDLTQLALPAAAFDVIVNFYYLDRALWPQYRRALKPGGVLIFETMTRAMLTVRPESNPAHLLAPGELSAAFADWERLIDFEGWHGNRAVAQLVARRPGGGG